MITACQLLEQLERCVDEKQPKTVSGVYAPPRNATRDLRHAAAHRRAALGLARFLVEYDAACIPDKRKIQLRRLTLVAETVEPQTRPRAELMSACSR